MTKGDYLQEQKLRKLIRKMINKKWKNHN
jgi:hypothetical protein